MVATPIGNLADISLRALEVLRAVPLVAAEDTRHSRRLWARHGLSTRLISYHARSPASRTEQLLDHLASGADLALVTDAGTPLVSDPGSSLVGGWAERGGRLIPIPGPSAVLAALVASGLPVARWSFEGFLPRRGGERRERLARIRADDRATVLFEAPGRTAGTLEDLRQTCGDARRAAVCRELTKLHEETVRGTLGELTRRAGEQQLRGEVTIVIAGATARDEVAVHTEIPGVDASAEARSRVAALVREGMARSAAARTVARETGLARRDLFKETLS